MRLGQFEGIDLTTVAQRAPFGEIFGLISHFIGFEKYLRIVLILRLFLSFFSFSHSSLIGDE